MQSDFAKVPSELSQRITRLLSTRHKQVLPVQAEIARWREVDNSLTELAAALADLRRHPSVSPGDAPALVIPHLDGMRADIAETVEAYSAVEARFSRETVNVGVSGSARVGKSTLLQSISGLADDQIPTGRDIPVTAVRSRIYHSARPPIALLRLHSPETFLDEVISPYHQALHMTRTPGTLDEFRSWAYPDSPQGPEARSGDVALLRRLREMQEALWSYEKDLTGGDKTVRLEDLRPYVAYPTSAERAASSRLEHRYLAVRDVRIDCEFPQADVDQLGIVDLPGLGEVAADAEKHHVTGLRHDVDVVLLVKRAAEAMAYWSAADAQAINLLDEARGSIRNRGDFVYLVVNSRPQDAALRDALRADIVRQVNDGQENRYFCILSTDAANPELVRENVLSPLLHALADRLPVMDEEFLAGARDRAEATRSRIRSALGELTAGLSQLKTTSGDAREELEGKAKKLGEDLMYALGTLVRELEVQATSDDDDPEYVAAVEAAYGNSCAWIEGGFGVGESAWTKEAVNSFGKARGSAKYTTDQLNLIRVAISGFYAKLDDYFSARVEEARRQVGTILRASLGTLLTDIDPSGEKAGTAMLKRAVTVFTEASPPCHDFASAIQVLIDLNVEYRTQFHPRVREQLEGLRAELKDAGTGRRYLAIAVDLDDAGARRLYAYCSERARQAAHKTRTALLAEKVTPLMVIFSAVEQFEDALIRSGTSDRDFERLAFSYRDELWPGVYAGLTEAHSRYAKVTRLIKTISEKLA